MAKFATSKKGKKYTNTAKYSVDARQADSDVNRMNATERAKYETDQNANNAEYAQNNATYSGYLNDLAAKVANRQPFSYDYNTDQSYQAYAKQYQGLGASAANNTLGTAAANTGGVASSYAVSAAAQAQNSYMQQLSNIIPTLEQNAYNRYTAENEANMNAMNSYANIQNQAYNQYAQNREYYWNRYNDQKNYNQSNYWNAANNALTKSENAADRKLTKWQAKLAAAK